jgi:hypothetical protein
MGFFDIGLKGNFENKMFLINKFNVKLFYLILILLLNKSFILRRRYSVEDFLL